MKMTMAEISKEFISLGTATGISKKYGMWSIH
jgi:hypothetical protein